MRKLTILLAVLVHLPRPDAAAAGGDCVSLFRRPPRIVTSGAVVAPFYAPQVNYFVGQPIRVEAIVQKALTEHPQYQEFLEFQRFKAKQKQKATGMPPAPPKPGQRASVQSGTLAATCGKCHGGNAPKAGLLLDGSAKIPAVAFEKIVTWLSGEVPVKGKTMPGVIKAAIAAKKQAAILREMITINARKEEE